MTRTRRRPSRVSVALPPAPRRHGPHGCRARVPHRASTGIAAGPPPDQRADRSRTGILRTCLRHKGCRVPVASPSHAPQLAPDPPSSFGSFQIQTFDVHQGCACQTASSRGRAGPDRYSTALRRHWPDGRFSSAPATKSSAQTLVEVATADIGRSSGDQQSDTSPLLIRADPSPTLIAIRPLMVCPGPTVSPTRLSKPKFPKSLLTLTLHLAVSVCDP